MLVCSETTVPNECLCKVVVQFTAFIWFTIFELTTLWWIFPCFALYISCLSNASRSTGEIPYIVKVASSENVHAFLRRTRVNMNLVPSTRKKSGSIQKDGVDHFVIESSFFFRVGSADIRRQSDEFSGSRSAFSACVVNRSLSSS